MLILQMVPRFMLIDVMAFEGHPVTQPKLEHRLRVIDVELVSPRKQPGPGFGRQFSVSFSNLHRYYRSFKLACNGETQEGVCKSGNRRCTQANSSRSDSSKQWTTVCARRWIPGEVNALQHCFDYWGAGQCYLGSVVPLVSAKRTLLQL